VVGNLIHDIIELGDVMACLVFDVGIAFYVDPLQEYPELSVMTTRGAGLLPVS
jgi:hypothetical protein